MTISIRVGNCDKIYLKVVVRPSFNEIFIITLSELVLDPERKVIFLLRSSVSNVEFFPLWDVRSIV